MSTPTQKKAAATYATNRKAVYFRQPLYWNALQMAVEKRLIRASSASARVERLVAVDLRRIARALRKAGVTLPPELFN